MQLRLTTSFALILGFPMLLASKINAHELSMVCDKLGVKAAYSTPHRSLPNATHAYKYEKNLLGKFAVFDKQGAGEWKQWCTSGEGVDYSPYEFLFEPHKLIATCVVENEDTTTLNFKTLIFELKTKRLTDTYWAIKSSQECILR